MIIEQAIEYMDQISKDPFELEFSDNAEFEKFLLIEPEDPTLHKKSIIALLNIILAKGGDHDKEMVIYKVLSSFQ
jgi:hypothetical protein